MRGIISGEPVIIVSNGKIDQKKLYDLRFTTDDLMEALRNAGIFDVSEVQFAIVETTGKVNVLPKYKNRPVTNEDLDIRSSSDDPPGVVVQDGKIMYSSLRRLGLGEGWLKKVLEENKLHPTDIFIMTAESQAKYRIIKKELMHKAKGEKTIEKN